MKIGTKSIRSNVPQVDVGVIDDGASFDDPRAVQRYVLRKHIYINIGLLIYCAPCKLKYFEACGCCRILVEQPNSQK